MTCPHCQNDDPKLMERIGGGPLYTIDEAAEILDDVRNDHSTIADLPEDSALGRPMILCSVCSRLFEV